MRDLNVSVVMDCVRRHEPISRVDLSRVTRLGRSTITSIVGELLDRGFVRESGRTETAVGRKPVLVELEPRSRFVVGIKVAPGLVTAAVLDMRAQVLGTCENPLAPAPSAESLITQIVRTAFEALGRTATDRRRVIGAGIVSPGIVDYPRGGFIHSYFFGPSDIPVGGVIGDRLGMPCFMDNDANAVALAEAWYGAGRGRRNLLCVTIGIGIGSGIVIDGEVYRGATSGAGEIGHITIDENGPRCACGNSGCLEALASDGAVARSGARAVVERGPDSLLAEWSGGNPEAVTRDMVVRAALAGDEAARDIVVEAGRHMGVGIANAVNLLNPEIVVIGGEMAIQAGDLLLDAVRQSLAARSFATLARGLEIIPAKLGDDAWVVGAGALVLNGAFRLPTAWRHDQDSLVSISRLLASGS